MEYIIVGLIILVFILLYILLIQRRLSNNTYKENIVLKDEIKHYKDNINSYKRSIDQSKSYYIQLELQLKEVILLFVKSPIRIYTQGNFYNSYSFYNGRYYAKVNKKETNNKAEGIPVIYLPNNKNAVIDLYSLVYLYKTNPMLDINEIIKLSTVLKEDIVKNLGNKILKSYRR